jgi:hypothetical protein
MNYRRSPLLNAEREAHIAECRARRAPVARDATETVAEWMRRTGQQPERLPMHAVSPVNALRGKYA